MKAQSKKSRKNSQPIPLTPTQLKLQQDKLLMIDVRGWFEYVMGHIPGVQHLTRSQILQTIGKDQAIALVCLSGYRSQITAYWLIEQGYHKIYNLQGGLLAWKSQGFPTKIGNSP